MQFPIIQLLNATVTWTDIGVLIAAALALIVSYLSYRRSGQALRRSLPYLSCDWIVATDKRVPSSTMHTEIRLKLHLRNQSTSLHVNKLRVTIRARRSHFLYMLYRPIQVSEWFLDSLGPGTEAEVPNEGVSLTAIAKDLGLMTSTKGTIYDQEHWLSDLRPLHQKGVAWTGNCFNIARWKKSGVRSWFHEKWQTYINKLPSHPMRWSYQLEADVNWLPGIRGTKPEKSHAIAKLTPNLKVVIHPAFQYSVDQYQMKPEEAPKIARLNGWDMEVPV